MSAPDSGAKIRPYARLLTMLGEQLIKNDRIALTELIKNSYDADATVVSVDFREFDPHFEVGPSSSIVIIDDGDGMPERVVRDSWLNPAATAKLEGKRANPVTRRGRHIQGEKGIGRFAIFKIGSVAKMVTRPNGEDYEIVVQYDLRFLDLPLGGPDEDTKPPLYLDEVDVRIEARSPQIFTGADPRWAPRSGTMLEIAGLRSSWSSREVVKAYEDVVRLQPSGLLGSSGDLSFNVAFFRDGAPLALRDDRAARLKVLLEERPVLRVEGSFRQEDLSFKLDINGVETILPISDPNVRALRSYKRYFENEVDPRDVKGIECGPFEFTLYVFDFAANAAPEYALSGADKRLIRDHRIYLYRDGVRVLPYGDPDDDWLQLDVIRGTQGARQMLGNDQTVGFVRITQEGNPKLQDKTNREGLIEAGRAYADLVTLMQVAIGYIRSRPFATYRLSRQETREHERRLEDAVSQKLSYLSSEVQQPNLRSIALAAAKEFEAQSSAWRTRAERLEDLAGVGLSVDAASHDIISASQRAHKKAVGLAADFETVFPGNPRFSREFAALVELLEFIADRLTDVQGLFVSTRQRRRRLKVRDYVGRAQRMFATQIGELGVSVEIVEEGPELVALSTEAALLQVLVNFFDNALYWLRAGRVLRPRVRILLDGERETLVFSDNGPGVHVSDRPYIFEAFYSGKGDEGKGLGLYIARQLGMRMGFAVELVDSTAPGVLNGATFEVSFRPPGGSDEQSRLEQGS